MVCDCNLCRRQMTTVVTYVDDPAPAAAAPQVADDWDAHMFYERLRWRLAWERDRTGVTVTDAPGAAP